MATLTAPAVTCPAWCVLPAGHEDGCDIDGSRFIRHRVAFGDVEVEQPVVVEPDGVVETEPLVVWLDGHAYDVARAQHLAADLARALTAAGSGGSCGCVCATCWCTDGHCGVGACTVRSR